MRTPQKTKVVPAFYFESVVIVTDGPNDKGERIADDSDWVRSKTPNRSFNEAAQVASNFAENALLAGYEVIVRVVEDGTIEVRDYD